MKKIKVLITSGGTREYIDEVRVLTNISTGKLGAKIADKFLKSTYHFDEVDDFRYQVHFVHVKGSVLPEAKLYVDIVYHEVTDVQSVMDTLEKLVPEMDVVIHPMAVSDFGFRPTNTKLKSNDPQAFIQSLKDRIYQTPKILSHIKKWNPNCFLISFKFENGLSTTDLLNIAHESLIKNGCDLVIANDKVEMKRLDSHMSYFVEPNGNFRSIDGKDEIAKEIFNVVTTWIMNRNK